MDTTAIKERFVRLEPFLNERQRRLKRRAWGAVASWRSPAGEAYVLDPLQDLVPVCPNCHAVIHLRREGVYGVEEVRAMLRRFGT